jgi:hypothetical protein
MGSDIDNRRKVGQSNAGINITADIASEQASQPTNEERVAQLENDLRSVTKTEDRILLQEELQRVRSLQQEEELDAGAAARRRAASDATALERELANTKDPVARRVLETELARSQKVAGSPGAFAGEPTPVLPSAGTPSKGLMPNFLNGSQSRGLRPDVALRRAGMKAIYEDGNQDLSVGEFNQVKERNAAQMVKDSKYPSLPLDRVEPVKRSPVAEVTVEVPDTEEERAARIEATMNEPNIRNHLQVIQQKDAEMFPDGQDTPERKSFLESAISELWGPTGLFDKKDLARFAVIAAGGLLTGGSVGGSFRYAGLDTLKASDMRRAQEAAERKAEETAKAQMQKELRADLRRMDADSIKALDKKSPEIQAQAIDWMNQAKALELQGKYESSRELYRRANMLLTASPDVDDKNSPNSASKYTNHESGFWRGKDAVLAYTDGGKTAMVSQGGKWIPIDPTEFESKTAFRQNYEDITKSTQQMLEAKLRTMFGKGRIQDADAQSKALAHEFAGLKYELGRHVTPAQFAKMAEITISGLEPHQLAEGSIAGEALRKSFYLNAVMALRPNDTDLFRTKAGKINAPAHAQFVDELNKKIADNKASDPSYGVQQASDRREDTTHPWWDKTI